MTTSQASFNVAITADFSALYSSTFRFARFAARRLGASDAECDDLAQDAFMRLFKTKGVFTEKAARAYVALSIRTLVIDQSRSFRVRKGVSLTEFESSSNEGAESSIQSQQPTSDFGKEIQIAAIGEAIDRIPADEDRWFLTWFYRDGLSAKEIAGKTGHAISSVTCRLSRLRTKYRDLFVAAVETAESSVGSFVLSLQEGHQF